MFGQVKIERTQNGYIVFLLDYSSEKRVFTNFADMIDWLLTFFHEVKGTT